MNSIQTNLKKDCSLILDAIERLKNGVWQLSDEDSEWAYHLLPKIKEALMEHIEYEKACALPQLPKDKMLAHSIEHENILTQIGNLEAQLKSTDASHFHSALELLIKTLQIHHDNFGFQKCHDHHLSEESIADRSLMPSLEYPNK